MAGRGGTTETPAAAPLHCDTSVHCTCTFYTALLIHFALRSIYTGWRSYYPINHSVCVGISGLYVSWLTVKV